VSEIHLECSIEFAFAAFAANDAICLPATYCQNGQTAGLQQYLMLFTIKAFLA
jgi:hypothetical protein